MYKLMLIDDEALMRRGIKSLADLHSLGIEEVVEASNGEEALLLCESFTPDLVLLDINMPKMDGLTFAKHLKEKSPMVKICMITGYDYFEYAVQALRAGVDEYILKPVTRKDINEVLKKLVQLIEKDAISTEINRLTKGEKQETKLVRDTTEQQIKNFVEEGVYHSDFSLTTLAEQVGFSTGYLSGVFKETFGLAFQDYVTKMRIEKAKLLLLSTDKKNYEISDEVGFEDVNYFATRFKKMVGSTPKQYRNLVRGRDV